MWNVVFGAGGGVGLACVQRLVELGKPVKAVVRDPSKYADTFPSSSQLEIVKGDVTDAESVKECLKDASTAIFAASGKGYWSAADVDKDGVKRVADAAKEGGVKQVVLVSSALVTTKNRLNPIRVLLNNIRYGLMDNKLAGENLLRASGVSYTVVRPGGLTNKPAFEHKIVAGQGDSGTAGSISRADVAAVCVAALSEPAALNTTFELRTDPKEPGSADQLPSIFTGLEKDSGPQ